MRGDGKRQRQGLLNFLRRPGCLWTSPENLVFLGAVLAHYGDNLCYRYSSV